MWYGDLEKALGYEKPRLIDILALLCVFEQPLYLKASSPNWLKCKYKFYLIKNAMHPTLDLPLRCCHQKRWWMCWTKWDSKAWGVVNMKCIRRVQDTGRAGIEFRIETRTRDLHLHIISSLTLSLGKVTHTTERVKCWKLLMGTQWVINSDRQGSLRSHDQRT